MPRPKHPKPDANQAEIVTDLRNLGFVVHDVSSLGGDCLDLFVGDPRRGLWLQVEVKDVEGRLTPDEEQYILTAGVDLPIIVSRTVGGVIDWFGEH